MVSKSKEPPTKAQELETLGRDFPRFELRRGDRLYRAHDYERGAWWFASGKGRFDLRRPLGTCYLATERTTAIVESLLPKAEPIEQGFMVVTEDVVSQLTVRHLAMPKGFLLADFTVDDITGFGLDREVSVSTDRNFTRRWARTFNKVGRGGIIFDSRRRTHGSGVAIFGNAGEARWPQARATRITSEDRERMAREHRVLVVPRPSVRSLSAFVIK